VCVVMKPVRARYMRGYARRWRKISCCFGKNRQKEAQKDIRTLARIGFKAKIWAPLPQHKTSGHVHVSMLATQKEYDAFLNYLYEKAHGKSVPVESWKDFNDIIQIIQNIREGKNESWKDVPENSHD